jgi:hypothetical protein
MQHGGCWCGNASNKCFRGTNKCFCKISTSGHDVSLGEKLIYVQTTNGVAHNGIDCELELDLMAEQQDDAAVEGHGEANHYAAAYCRHQALACSGLQHRH